MTLVPVQLPDPTVNPRGRRSDMACLRERFDQPGLGLELQRIEALTATVAERGEEAPTAAPGAPGGMEAPAEGIPSWWTRTVRKVAGG